MYQKKARGAKPWIIMACVIESLGRMAAIEAYPPRTGLYDYYGVCLASIAVVGIDYRAYVVEPV